MNRRCFLLYILISIPMHTLFTNETFIITSFPNMAGDRYTFSSFDTIIYTDFSLSVAPGATLSVVGKRSRNSFFIDKKSHILSQDCFSLLLKKFALFRINLSQKILKNYPRSGALILALVLGNKYYLPEEFNEYVRFSGLSHVFALSGLHIVIAIGLVMYLLKFFHLRQKLWGILTLPFSFLYLLLGGFGITLQRAVLFHIIGSVYQYFRIPSSGKSVLLIAFLLNVILLPRNTNTLSFWLSYVSVFGIIFSYQYWYDMVKHWSGKVFSSVLATSLSVSLFITPILIGVFGYINLLSLISNLLVVPLVPILLVLCFLSVFLMQININIDVLDIVIEYCYQFLFIVVKYVSEIPFAVIFFESRTFALIISMLILVVMTSIIIKKRYYAYME